MLLSKANCIALMVYISFISASPEIRTNVFAVASTTFYCLSCKNTETVYTDA